MPGFMTVSHLAETKSRLGNIEFLDFRGLDLVNAHQELGKDVRLQVQKILRKKLDELDEEQLSSQARLVRQCRKTIEDKISSLSIDHQIRDGLKKYLACLSAWSMGAELNEFQHQRLQSFSIDGTSISSEDLALLLQNDNTGCQTGIYREQNGSIVLWHTEEDEEEPGIRFDKLRIAFFQKTENSQSKEISAFIYPEILPGPAYCWHSDGYVQAIDSLYLKQNHQKNCIFANIATWITFLLGKDLPQEEIIKSLSPFVDGYALTAVQRNSSTVSAKIIEFAGDKVNMSSLADSAGSYLFQVNLVSNKSDPIAMSYQEIDEENRRYYNDRVDRTNRVMKSIKPPPNSLRWFFRLIASRLGGDGAYANEYVKSYFIYKMSINEVEIWIGAGPALIGDNPTVITQKY
jgi:hypothetical protein